MVNIGQHAKFKNRWITLRDTTVSSVMNVFGVFSNRPFRFRGENGPKIVRSFIDGASYPYVPDERAGNDGHQLVARDFDQEPQ